MDGPGLFRWLEQLLGAALVLTVLVDVFLTVLYARIGTGILSSRVARGTWWVFRKVARRSPRRRDAILSYCGPVVLVMLVFTWLVTLILGGALLTHPNLGTAVRAVSGPTPTDFFTAMYVAGDSLTTVGTSDIAPQTAFFRLAYTANSVIGMCVITLTVTYFLQVYNALHSRNAFALKVHLATGETGDAAELIAGLGPEGEFTTGYAHLVDISAEMTTFKESHHFQPVLLYFRFEETYYSVTRVALVSLDTVALIKTTLDDRRYGWLKESAAVAHLWRASMRLIVMLGNTMLPGRINDAAEPADPADEQRWRRRHAAAIRRIRQAGIETVADERAAADTYVTLRLEWDRYIRTFARYMAHDLAEIDPAGCRPESADERPAFRGRLRSAG
jgi:hypothetical protein